MEHGRSDGDTHSGASAGSSALSASWAEWDAYYKKASRRRRSMGRGRNLREEKRKRRLRERLGIGISALLVLAMTGVFYLVLK
jgi:hypothetical protein